MAVKITNTKELAEHFRILVFGMSGIGKTRLISTTPKPVIVSSEAKAMPMEGEELPVLVASTNADLHEALGMIRKDYVDRETICIDSLTDIGESLVSEFKKELSDKAVSKGKNPGDYDGRQAYGLMAQAIFDFLHRIKSEFSDKHIYVIARILRYDDPISGLPLWSPSMPGQNWKNNLPYFFNMYFALRKVVFNDGSVKTCLQTEPDIQYTAKGFSPCLNKFEKPDLTRLFNKILRSNDG